MSHFYLAPESEATFRAVTHSLLISHIPKKCHCGKQTTPKDLKQYGQCVACQKTAKMQLVAMHQVCGQVDLSQAETGNRRFVVFPSAWTKARTA